MFTQQNLENLFNNIDIVNDMVKKRGFDNIRLFKPKLENQADKLHFLVDIKNTDVSIFDKARLKQELTEILQCQDIIVAIESTFDDEGKDKIIGEQIAITPQNKQNLVKFCSEKLLMSPYIPPVMQEVKLEITVLENLLKIQKLSPTPEGWNKIDNQLQTIKQMTENSLTHEESYAMTSSTTL